MNDEIEAACTRLKILWQEKFTLGKGAMKLRFIAGEDGRREIHTRKCRLDPCTCSPSGKPFGKLLRSPRLSNANFDKYMKDLLKDVGAA